MFSIGMERCVPCAICCVEIHRQVVWEGIAWRCYIIKNDFDVNIHRKELGE